MLVIIPNKIYWLHPKETCGAGWQFVVRMSIRQLVIALIWEVAVYAITLWALLK